MLQLQTSSGLINFNPVIYSVDEGDTEMLTLVLTNPSASEVTVDVTLNAGSATSKSIGILQNNKVLFTALLFL